MKLLPRAARRFFAYGVIGWGLEVCFTGLTGAFFLRDRKLQGQTYLWMLPIYGAGGLVLERAQAVLQQRKVPRWARALVYMAGIYVIEYGSADLLYRTGVGVPWNYERGLNLRGYVRLDYAPFWYLCGLLFEGVHAQVGKLDRPSRAFARRTRPLPGELPELKLLRSAV